MRDELTRTRTRAALADLAEVQRKLTDPDTPAFDHDEAQAALPGLLRDARAAIEAARDPDPPEPEAVDLLADPATVAAALDAPDPVQYLVDLALRSGAQTAGPEALRRVLRHGHRDEAAPADLVEIADRELRRRERAARRAERLALLDADVDELAGDGGDAARKRLRGARTALDAVRTMRPVVSAAQHAEPVTDWTGMPPDREWLLPGWLAVGRVHLLTGSGGRGKSRLALQLAAALAADSEAWPLPWQTAGRGPLPSDRHPPTLPRTGDGGLPVVVASWEDEADEVHRRLQAQPVSVADLADRLHYVDAAEWGPLWAPEQGSRHVQTVAELTAAGRRLRRLCERVHARLLIVDPLAAAYGSDENVRGLVRQFMASWDAWGRAQRCAVLMIAHPPKQGAGDRGTDGWWSGSTDWPAAARSAWALEPAGDLTRLVCHKASYGMAPDPVHLAADGVTWRAAWEPRPETVGDKVNGTGKVPADVDTSEA